MTDQAGAADEGMAPHPRRMIGPWQASSVVVGMVVGAGIFRSASVVAGGLGSEAAIYAAWAFGGFVALVGALCYAELSTAFPDPGGDYRFLKEAFGAPIAFLFAWSRFAVIFTASAAMLAFVATDYLAQLVPMSPPVRAVIASLTIIALSAINLRGLKTSARSQVILVALDVAALLALGAGALWLAGHHVAPIDAAPPLLSARWSFGAALVYVMLAYGGFNDAATLSAEVRSPRDMTRAMIGGMAAVTALYLIANWAYLRVLGQSGLAASGAPAAAVMQTVFGETGQVAMVVAVGAATLAVLNALLIVGGRTLFAAARDVPRLARFADWDEQRSVPHAAILAQTAITLLLVAWGSLTPTGFATMVDYMAPVYWLFLTLSAVALPILRLKRPDVDRPYRVPLNPLLPLFFAAVTFYVLVASIQYVGWVGSVVSFGTLAVGLVLRAMLMRARAPDPAQSL